MRQEAVNPAEAGIGELERIKGSLFLLIEMKEMLRRYPFSRMESRYLFIFWM